MPLDKSVLVQLRRYASAFRDARDRGTNEADTVMFLVKFFEEVLGYDSLKGEVSREYSVKDRFCDLALKLEGTPRILIEAKPSSLKGLVAKHIEQAENYASRAGIRWVLLTNGVEWKLYHVTFAEGEGISHDLAFEANLIDEVEVNAESLWTRLSLLCRSALVKGMLDDFWHQKKALSPASVVRALFDHEVLMRIRTELNRHAAARLDLQDVFDAVRDALSKEALLAAGDISISKKRKVKRKVVKTDISTGKTTIEESEVDEDAANDGPASLPFDAGVSSPCETASKEPNITGPQQNKA